MSLIKVILLTILLVSYMTIFSLKKIKLGVGNYVEALSIL